MSIKKTSLKLVGGAPAASPAPPRKLGQAGMNLWNSVQREFDISDCGGVELLLLAAQALDRAEQLREIIDRDGPVTRSKTGLRAHPGMRDEIQYRALVARLLRQLGIVLEPLRS